MKSFASAQNGFVSPRSQAGGYSKDFPRFASSQTICREEVASCVTLSEEKRLEHSGKDSSVAPLAQNDTKKVEQFTNERIAMKGHVHSTEDPTQPILEFLQSRSINRIHLEPGVLNEDALSKAGIIFSHEPDPSIRLGVTRLFVGWQIQGPYLKRMVREDHCTRRSFPKSI